MKKLKIVIIVVVVGGLAAAGIGKYFFDKKTVGLEEAKADFTLTCDSVFNSFYTNKAEANKKFIGKTIQLDGVVSSVDTSNGNVSVIYKVNNEMGNVVCRMDSTDAPKVNVKEGQSLSLKGECTGYEDDMLIEVSFNRCVLVNKK
ncbi:MAG: OB-fold protein [Bacteroidota bacterium]